MGWIGAGIELEWSRLREDLGGTGDLLLLNWTDLFQSSPEWGEAYYGSKWVSHSWYLALLLILLHRIYAEAS